jgi:hypothetical protein
MEEGVVSGQRVSGSRMFVEGGKENVEFSCRFWTTDDLFYCFLPL